MINRNPLVIPLSNLAGLSPRVIGIGTLGSGGIILVVVAPLKDLDEDRGRDVHQWDSLGLSSEVCESVWIDYIGRVGCRHLVSRMATLSLRGSHEEIAHGLR